MTDCKPIKLKSEAPQDQWREHLALYRLAHRLSLWNLCQTTLGIMSREIGEALHGRNARQLIKEIYALDPWAAGSLRKRVATEIVQQKLQMTRGLMLDDILFEQPALGYNLINAMRANERKLNEIIATLQLRNDCQVRQIDLYQQRLKESRHKEGEIPAISEGGC